MLKKKFITICFAAILILVAGCSANDGTVDSPVNSGPVDTEYVGDANVQLEEIYKQTTEEEQLQAEVLKKIEEGESVIDGIDMGGHF